MVDHDDVPVPVSRTSISHNDTFSRRQQLPGSTKIEHGGSSFLSEISDYIDDRAPDLLELSNYIHEHPELNFKEHLAHDFLTGFLRQQPGWTVIPHAYGIDTAFVAYYDTGRKGPVVSFNAEYGEYRKCRSCVMRG